MTARLPTAARAAHQAQLATLGIPGVTPAPSPAPAAPAAPVAAAPAPATVPTAPAPVQPVAAPVAPAAQPDDTAAELARLRAETEELKRRQSGADKARSDAELLAQTLAEQASIMQEQLRRMQAENEALATSRQAEVQAQVEQAAEVALPLSDAALTDAEKTKFGPETEAFVNKLIDARLRTVLSPLLGRVKELSQFRSEIGTRVATTEQATAAMAKPMLKVIGKGFLEEEIIPHFPDFNTRKQSPEWKKFISETEPGTGRKYADLLRDTMATQDALVARNLIGHFYLRHPSQPAATPTGMATEPSTVASGAGTGSPPVSPTQTVAEFPFSKYKNATAAFSKKQITRDQLHAIKAEYEAAAQAGKVNYSA